MATFVTTQAVVTDISIERGPSGWRLLIGADFRDAQGITRDHLRDDVTDLLTAPQKAQLDAITARAQAYADSKL